MKLKCERQKKKMKQYGENEIENDKPIWLG